jgi:hypothetical protein
MSSKPIEAFYRKQHDISKGSRNPEFCIGIAVYLDNVVDGPTGPQGSIAIELGPMDGLGEKRALNRHPSTVEIYAGLHQAMTALVSDPEVAEYVKTLAKLMKREEAMSRAQQFGEGKIAKMQRMAEINENTLNFHAEQIAKKANGG